MNNILTIGAGLLLILLAFYLNSSYFKSNSTRINDIEATIKHNDSIVNRIINHMNYLDSVYNQK